MELLTFQVVDFTGFMGQAQCVFSDCNRQCYKKNGHDGQKSEGFISI